LQVTGQADGTWLVENLVTGSPADQAGLRVGDLIQVIGEIDVRHADPSEAIALVRQELVKGRVALVIVRDSNLLDLIQVVPAEWIKIFNLLNESALGKRVPLACNYCDGCYPNCGTCGWLDGYRCMPGCQWGACV
jgi:hypothetical protein